jgi:RHS repeat-associated protein
MHHPYKKNSWFLSVPLLAAFITPASIAQDCSGDDLDMPGTSSALPPNPGGFDPTRVFIPWISHKDGSNNIPLGDGNSLNLNGGSFRAKVVDISIASPGMDFEFKRFYRGGGSGNLGRGWTHNWNVGLSHSQEDGPTPLAPKIYSNVVFYVDATGRRHIFEWKQQGQTGPLSYNGHKNAAIKLFKIENNRFEIRQKNGKILTFSARNASGTSPLESITDRNGNSLFCGYDVDGRLTDVTDLLGRMITFEYYSTGRLEKITDFIGRTWRYGYDDDDHLVTVVLPDASTSTPVCSAGAPFTYTYDTDGRLTSATYPADPGNPRYFLTYAADDGAVETYTVGAGAWQFDYWEFNLTPAFMNLPPQVLIMDVVSPNGNVSQYVTPYEDQTLGWQEHFVDRLPHHPLADTSVRVDQDYETVLFEGNNTLGDPFPIGGSPPAPENNPDPPDVASTSYSTGLTVARVIDKDGNVVEKRFSGPSIDDKVTRNVFEDRFAQVKTTVPPVAFPDGNVPLTSEFDLDLTDPNVAKFATTRIFDYEESDLGDQNGDGITSRETGNPVKIIYPTVETFGSFSDCSDCVAQITFELLQYNEQGQVISRIDSSSMETRFYYWPASDPIGASETTLPSSLVADDNMGYLAGTVEDFGGLNLTTIYRYDDRGNVTLETGPNGETVLYIYDNLDRLTVKKETVLHNQGQPGEILAVYETRFGYTANGQLSSRWTLNFNGDGIVDPANPWIEELFFYDAAGQLTEKRDEVTEGLFAVKQFFYDKEGNTVLIASPEAVAGSTATHRARILTKVYDELGRIYSETRGGWTSLFASLPAHDHIDLSAFASSLDAATTRYEFLDAGSNGLEVIKTDPDGFDWLYRFDHLQRQVYSEDPLGNYEQQLFDSMGHLVSRTQGMGATVLSDHSFVYDEGGRQIESHVKVLDQNGVSMGADLVTSSLYDVGDRLLKKEDPRGLVSTWEYDGVGRRTAETDAKGNRTEFDLDAAGNVVEKRRIAVESGSPVTYTTLFDHDLLARRVSTTLPSGQTTYADYDSRGNVVQVENAVGHTVSRIFDGLGRKVQEAKDLGEGLPCQNSDFENCATVQWSYDLNGRLLTVLDAELNPTSYDYDSLDRQILTQTGAASSWDVEQRTFNARGLLSNVIDPNGTTLIHDYDAAGRLTQLTTYPHDGGVIIEGFGYDALGRQTLASNGDTTGPLTEVRLALDSLGQTVSETLEDLTTSDQFTVLKQFDANGNLLRIDYPLVPGESTAMVAIHTPVNDLNQTGSISVDGQALFSFEFDDSHVLQRRVTTPGTGVSWHMLNGFDSARRLISVSHQFLTPPASPDALADHTYGYDGLDRLRFASRLDQGDVGDLYDYDGASQLTGVRAGVANPSSKTFASARDGVLTFYDYDRANNREVVDDDSVTTTYSTSLELKNQYDLVDSSSLLYDDNGNLLSDGSFDYFYDHRNHLVLVEQGGSPVVMFSYDALGRRFKKTIPGPRGSTRIDVWSGAHVVLQLHDDNSNGSIDRSCKLVYGQGLDRILMLRVNGSDYYPLADIRGNVTQLLGASGDLVESYSYDAFGNPSVFDGQGSPIPEPDSGLANPALFTGRTWEPECQLYYHRARYYSPALGRFLNRDPIGHAGGLNLYAYTGNDPVNRTDRMGTDDETPNPADLFWGVTEVVAGIGGLVADTAFALEPTSWIGGPAKGALVATMYGASAASINAGVNTLNRWDFPPGAEFINSPGGGALPTFPDVMPPTTVSPGDTLATGAPSMYAVDDKGNIVNPPDFTHITSQDGTLYIGPSDQFYWQDDNGDWNTTGDVYVYQKNDDGDFQLIGGKRDGGIFTVNPETGDWVFENYKDSGHTIILKPNGNTVDITPNGTVYEYCPDGKLHKKIKAGVVIYESACNDNDDDDDDKKDEEESDKMINDLIPNGPDDSLQDEVEGEIEPGGPGEPPGNG